MDVAYFLRQRMAFISNYFDVASAPFLETMRKIEEQEAPFVPPEFDPDTMDSSPAFLDEWLQAQAGAEIVGQTSVSMLSEALKAYFVTIERLAGLDCEASYGTKSFKKGFIQGYRTCFAAQGIDWSSCPADFKILEQVVLARNASQHSVGLMSPNAKHSKDTLSKHPNPLFISEYENDLLKRHGGSWLTEPNVHVTRASLNAALSEVEKLARWYDED